MQLSLYEKLGGITNIQAVVIDFYRRISASQSLAPYFQGINMERLINHQTKFMCQMLGGPTEYTGRDLARAHAHLSVTPQAFAEVAAHLESALKAAGVSAEDVATIIREVAAAKSQVVTQHSS